MRLVAGAAWPTGVAPTAVAAGSATEEGGEASPVAVPAPAPAPADGAKRLVAVTSCPTGIAHTFMAAEGLRKAAEEMGHWIKVETQGSVGAKNVITEEDVA